MSARLDKPRKGYRTELPASRFSRQWFAQGLRTCAWVAVITILVWVYADIHFTADEDVVATLRIHTGLSNEIALLSRSDVSIKFHLKGKRNSIDRFLDRLSTNKSVLTYNPARALSAGQHRERVAEILADLVELRDSGLEIVWARPRDIDIYLDNFEDLPGVRVKPEFGGVVLDGSARVEPSNIKLRIPKSQMKNISSQNQLFVPTKPINPGDDAAVGETRTVKVEVLPPPGISHARLIPSMVSVTFKIGQRTSSRKIKVSVGITMPKSWLDGDFWSKHEAQAKHGETWTRLITVSGSPIDLEKLTAENIQANINLTESDKQRVGLASWWPGKVKVQFPAGLKIRLAEPIPDIEYRLVKRSESPAPPS